MNPVKMLEMINWHLAVADLRIEPDRISLSLEVKEGAIPRGDFDWSAITPPDYRILTGEGGKGSGIIDHAGRTIVDLAQRMDPNATNTHAA